MKKLIAGLYLSSVVLANLAASAPSQAPQLASYVRVCRAKNGLPDRRACTPSDLSRTQLASL